MAKLSDVATLIKELTYDDMVRLAEELSLRINYNPESTDQAPEVGTSTSSLRCASALSDWAGQALSEKDAGDD